jgi:Leucine-rich repeat (LRR) protein
MLCFPCLVYPVTLSSTVIPCNFMLLFSLMNWRNNRPCTFKKTNLLLADNMLSGEIPRAIFRLSSLQYLGLGYNMLRMVLPPNMGDLFSNLIQLGLQNNSFEDQISGSLGNAMGLQLGLQNNSFEGQISGSLGNAMGLQAIDLSFNNFTGQIPSFGKLSNLTFLSLQYNQLVARDDKSCEFLNALGNCKSLEMLSLVANNLEGSLPPSIGNLSSTNLQHLLLGRNRLSGQVPESIGKLSTLIRLALNDNLISGTIDGWLENLKGLQGLMRNSNNFSGPIPFSIDKLIQLTMLDLSKNEFGVPYDPAWEVFHTSNSCTLAITILKDTYRRTLEACNS